MRCVVVALAVALVAGHSDHHDHDHDHHDHDHDHHDHHDDHHDHDHHDHAGHDHERPMELSAASWESTVVNSPHIWAVNFHSGMCSSCQAFKPEWEALAHAVDGLCVAALPNPLLHIPGWLGSCRVRVWATHTMSPFHCPSRRHWGELNIDHAENIPVAKRYGVLKEGIPNIKLFGVGAEPVPIMTGDVLTAAVLAPTLKQQLGASGAEMDSAHFYLSPHADRSEL